MKVCAKCGGKIGRRDKFCGKCGSSEFNDVPSKAKYCLYCGEMLDARAKFCSKCGKSCEGDISLSFLGEKKEVPNNVDLDFLKTPEEIELEKAVAGETASARTASEQAMIAEEEARIAEEEAKRALEEAERAREAAERAAERAKLGKEKAEEAARIRREEEERLRAAEEEQRRKMEEERLRREEEERIRREEEEKRRKEEEERRRLEEEERKRKEEEERLRREEEERLRKEEEERLRREEEERRRKEEEERRKAEEKRLKELKELHTDALNISKKALDKYGKNPDSARSNMEAALDKLKELYEKAGMDEDVSDTKEYYHQLEEILGIIYYKEKAYKLAIPLLKGAADQERPKARVYYAQWLLRNRGDIKGDPGYILDFVNDAMEKDLGEEEIIVAYRVLAKIYRDGIGVSKDLTSAYDYYKMAAEKGDVTAIATVGQCLMYGEGVKKDSKEAFEWNLKAAEQGNEMGMRNVAVSYDLGTGVKRDAKQAIDWYKKLLSKMENDRFAMYRIALCLSNPDRDHVYKPSTEDYAEARRYAEMALEKGEENANYVLGYLYMNGYGVSGVNYNKAMSYFMNAANHGNNKAKEKMQLFTKNGMGNYILK